MSEIDIDANLKEAGRMLAELGALTFPDGSAAPPAAVIQTPAAAPQQLPAAATRPPAPSAALTRPPAATAAATASA